MDIKTIVNTPEFRAWREKAAPLIEAVYGPPPWWAGSWMNDPKVEAVAIMLYTGALVLPGASGKPDPQVAALQARIDAAKRALG